MCFSSLPQTPFVYEDVIRSSSFPHIYTINKPSELKILSHFRRQRKHFTFALLQVSLGSVDIVGNET